MYLAGKEKEAAYLFGLFELSEESGYCSKVPYPLFEN
jgi:hypothetical protein